MKVPMQQLGDIIEELRDASKKSEKNEQMRRLDSVSSKNSVYIFYSKKDGIYIGFFHDTEKIILPEVPLINGLEISIVEENGRIGTRFRPADQSMRQVFEAFANHLIGKMPSSDNAKQLISFLSKELKVWKLFFSSSMRPLGQEAILGLAGELHVLGQLISQRQGAIGKLLTCWQGPFRSLHDFKFETFELEIKSSSSQKNRRLRISNPNQLQDIPKKKLYVANPTFNWAHDAQSLPELVETIRQLVGSSRIGSQNLDEALAAAGYHDIHIDHYSNPNLRFQHEETLLYRVTNGFPRIDNLALGPDILIHSYSISIEACEEFRVGGIEHLRGQM